MRILGIDPGTQRTGYCAISSENNELKFLRSGVIDLRKYKSIELKISYVVENFLRIVGAERFDYVAIESLIFAKNAHSLIMLGQIRGAILSECVKLVSAENIRSFSPNEIKEAISGYGHGRKELISKCLQNMFPGKIFSSGDESDACAAAVTLFELLRRGMIGKGRGKDNEQNSKIKNTNSLAKALLSRIEILGE